MREHWCGFLVDWLKVDNGSVADDINKADSFSLVNHQNEKSEKIFRSFI